MKIFGALSLLVGFFLLIGGPGDTSIQIIAYGNTARLLGLILILVGIVLVTF